MSTITIYKDNQSPSLEDTISINGAPFDLTGSTVKLRMRPERSSTLKVDAAATIVTPASGLVRYDWVAADVDTAGVFEAWWRVTLAGGDVQETPRFQVVIDDPLASTNVNLFTIQELKNHLRSIKPTDTSKDAHLELLAQTVSDAAAAHTNHRWALEDATAKTFRYDESDGFLDLAPWDLRSIDTVQVDTDISPVTLDASQFRKEPRNAPHGVYSHLDLYLGAGAASTSFWSDQQPGWAGREVRVTGSWGWETIPPSLKLAALELAAQIFSNPASAVRLTKADSSRDYASGDTDTLAIPDSILEIWDRFRRVEF